MAGYNGQPMTDHPTPDLALLDDPRLTTLGLLLETHAGVRAAIEPELDGGGVPGSSFEVLIRLARSPGQRLRMTELAAQSTLSNSGLTRVVDRLVAAGLAERVPDRHDRRVCWAAITNVGLVQLLAVLPAHLRSIDQVITQVLEPHELDAFTHALRKIRSVANPGADPSRTAPV